MTFRRISEGGQPWRRGQRRVDAAQIKAEVLQGLAQGLPLAVVARRNEVTQKTIDLWKRRDPAFLEDVAEARTLGWDNLAVECLEIADDCSGDVLVTEDGLRPNSANVLSRRLRIETRLKLLAIWDQGRYGTPNRTLKVEAEINTTTRHVLDPRLLDDEGREALRHLLTHAQAQGLVEGPEPAVDAEFEEAEPSGPEEDVADG